MKEEENCNSVGIIGMTGGTTQVNRHHGLHLNLLHTQLLVPHRCQRRSRRIRPRLTRHRDQLLFLQQNLLRDLREHLRDHRSQNQPESQHPIRLLVQPQGLRSGPRLRRRFIRQCRHRDHLLRDQLHNQRHSQLQDHRHVRRLFRLRLLLRKGQPLDQQVNRLSILPRLMNHLNSLQIVKNHLKAQPLSPLSVDHLLFPLKMDVLVLKQFWISSALHSTRMFWEGFAKK